MPKPKLANGTAFDLPPESIKETNPDLYEYLIMFHIRAFGVLGGTGDLDADNINGLLTDTVDHNEFINVTAFQHHGAGSHDEVDKASSSSDVPASTVSVTASDAGTVSSSDATDLATVIVLANEIKADYNAAVILINELKADLGTLVTDVNVVQSGQNDLKGKLRTAGILAT